MEYSPMEFLSSHFIESLLIVLLFICFLIIWLIIRQRKYSGGVLVGKTGMDYKQEAFKVIPYPVVIISDKDIILYVNPAAEKIFSARLRQLVGKCYQSVFSLVASDTELAINDFSSLADTSAWKECELNVDDKNILTVNGEIKRNYRMH